MAFPEFVDLRIAAEAAHMQLNENQRTTLEEISEKFDKKIKGLNLNPMESLKIFQETLLETEGATEAFELEGALVVFNLQTLKNNLKL